MRRGLAVLDVRLTNRWAGGEMRFGLDTAEREWWDSGPQER